MDILNDIVHFLQEPVFDLPMGVEDFFVMVGVLMGSLYACDRKLDVVGVVTMGLVTGYGGGILRDLLLQSHGVYFMEHPLLIVVCVALCLLVFYVHRFLKYADAWTFFLDALSVALFAIAGAQKALFCDTGIIIAIMLGAITAVGGGALRDICSNEVPSVFRSGNFYAIAALCGAMVFVLTDSFGVPQMLAGFLCVFTVVAIRYLSVYFNWRTKSADEVRLFTTRMKESTKVAREAADLVQSEGVHKKRSLLKTIVTVFLQASIRPKEEQKMLKDLAVSAAKEKAQDSKPSS